MYYHKPKDDLSTDRPLCPVDEYYKSCVRRGRFRNHIQACHLGSPYEEQDDAKKECLREAQIEKQLT